MYAEENWKSWLEYVSVILLKPEALPLRITMSIAAMT
jgi:hypothetical protein